MEDARATPQKYAEYDFWVDYDDSSLDSQINEMEKLGEKAKWNVAKGNTSSAVALGAMIDPSVAIMAIDINTYADPMNIVIQQYNLAILNRKLNTYAAYMMKTNAKTQEVLADIEAQYIRQWQQIHEQECQDSGTVQISGGSGSSNDSARIAKEHQKHVKLANSLNSLSTNMFMQASSTASVAYLQKVKQTA